MCCTDTCTCDEKGIRKECYLFKKSKNSKKEIFLDFNFEPETANIPLSMFEIDGMPIYYHVPNPQFRSTSGLTSGVMTTSALRQKDDLVDVKATLASAFHYCASHSLVLPLPQSETGNDDFARLGSMLNFECICLVWVFTKNNMSSIYCRLKKPTKLRRWRRS